MKTKLGDEDLAKAIINMVDVGVNINGINNTTPTYVAMGNYYETKANGTTTWFLHIPNVQAFWEKTMGLVPKHIYALRDEANTHPRDLANFDSGDFDSVIQSVKGKAVSRIVF